MEYGLLPKQLGIFEVDCDEMFFYQYLPIKMPNQTNVLYEKRLYCFNKIVGVSCCDFIGEFGLNNYVESYVYLTAKRLYQSDNNKFNREGWHSDGFLTNDINYIWSDKFPTTFNKSKFNLTKDDKLSILEMQQQAQKINDVFYNENELLRLNQYNIHRVSNIDEPAIRTFLKISISKDKYDLKGNSHNYLLDYKWQMRERNNYRNIPQKLF